MKYTAEDFANQIGEFRRKMAGMVRRMVVKLSDGGVWQVAGHLLFEGQREAPPAENYPGIGFAARPPAGTSAEAIVVQVGGANQPAIVGLRDEATRAKVSDIAANETAAYNSLVRAYLKASGTIELRTHAGVAQPTIKGTTYRTAEDVMLTALAAAFTALASAPIGAPAQSACTAAATAITTFQTSAATYLATVAKVE